MKRLLVSGSINWDITMHVDHMARIDERVLIKRLDYVPGGTGANVAVAAARLLKPHTVAFIGAVGDDDWGKKHFEVFKKEGVYAEGLIMIHGVPSGQAYILVDKDGHNSIYLLRGANDALSPEMLNTDKILSLVKSAAILTVTNPPLPVIHFLLDNNNGQKIWDPGGYATTLGPEKYMPILNKVDMLILNEFEAKSMFGSSDIKTVFQKLSGTSVKTVIIKKGAKGAVAITENELIQKPALDLKKLGFTIVNTTGCGDAFLGGLCAALIEEKTLDTALSWAVVSGGINATNPETRGSPDKNLLQKYLNYLK